MKPANQTITAPRTAERSPGGGQRVRTFENFIGGRWSAPAGGEYFENVTPAYISDVVGRFPLSGQGDLERAVASAREGFELWRRVPAPQRGDVLRRVGDLLVARKVEIANLMTR